MSNLRTQNDVFRVWLWICLAVVLFSSASLTATDHVRIYRADAGTNETAPAEATPTNATEKPTNNSLIRNGTSSSSSNAAVDDAIEATTLAGPGRMADPAPKPAVDNVTSTNSTVEVRMTAVPQGRQTQEPPDPYPKPIVETRPDLVHPGFWTYLLIVTLPCIVGWCFITLVCLWICRPHSPLYREILKRLIEHSQMKQKSVLFSATVLGSEQPQEGTSQNA